jgi:hypothetical protein
VILFEYTSLSFPCKRESRLVPAKAGNIKTEIWIPRIKYGAGLLEFIPVKTGTEMAKRGIG